MINAYKFLIQFHGQLIEFSQVIKQKKHIDGQILMFLPKLYSYFLLPKIEFQLSTKKRPATNVMHIF